MASEKMNTNIKKTYNKTIRHAPLDSAFGFLRRMAYVSQKVHFHSLTVSLLFHIINLRIRGNKKILTNSNFIGGISK